MHATKKQQALLEILTKREDFVHAQKHGKKWVSHGLIIQAIPNDLNKIRVGYTVTKRTEKSAVKRNRIKRRLRSVAAEVLSLHGQTSYDYVLIGRSDTRTRLYSVLKNDLIWCLKKMELLRNNN